MRYAQLLVAGMALLGSALAAEAADLYGYGSAKDFEDHPALARALGWYLRIDGGFAINEVGGLAEAGYGSLAGGSVANSGVLGGGIGLNLGRNLRVDVTGDYRFEADATGTSYDMTVPGERRIGIHSALLLANIYYDFDLGRAWRPYVGAGLGAVLHSTSGGTIAGVGSFDGDDRWNFAGALMAGVTINLGGRSAQGGSVKDPVVYQEASGPLSVDLGYRFLLLGDAATGTVRDAWGNPVYDRATVEDITAHEFRIGLRYDFR